MQPYNIIELLTKSALFSHLPEPALQQLAKQARIIKRKRGEIIIHVGQPTEGMFMVLSGVVTLSVTSPQGNSRIIEIINSGRSFGEALLFIQNNSPVQAEVSEESRLLFISEKAISVLLDDSPQSSRAMLAGLSARLHQLISNVEQNSLHRAHQRVIGYLLGEVNTLNDISKNNVHIELPVTKRLIASKLGISAETFSRVLQELSHEGLISVQGKKIELVNCDTLRRYYNIPL